MGDLYRREKVARLPRPLSTAAKHTQGYSVGDIAYWPPGGDLALFYRHDGERIPDPGIVVIGRMTAGVEALDRPGAVTVTIERMTDSLAAKPTL